MRLRVQVVIEPDDDGADSDQQTPVAHEVATIARGDLSVDTLGMQGETVSVKDGYARNFLLPRQLAIAASLRINHF